MALSVNHYARALLAVAFTIAAAGCGSSGGNIGQAPRDAGADAAEESGGEGGTAADASAAPDGVSPADGSGE